MRRRLVQLRQLTVCLLGVLLIRAALVDWQTITSGSMMPTLVAGDRVLVSRLAYDLRLPMTDWRIELRDPGRGDIVVFSDPIKGERTIKRVVGMPGDLIEIRENVLFRNGMPASYSPINDEFFEHLPAGELLTHNFSFEHINNHPYPVMTLLRDIGPRRYGPIAVPVGTYFVLGDNRDNSADSRVFGFVPRPTITGKAIGVAVSFDPSSMFGLRVRRSAIAIP